MYALKGFASIDTLISNVPNTIAPVGELSTYSMTFAKEKTLFTSSVNKSITIVGFSSKSNLTGAVTLPGLIQDKMYSITNWIFNRQTATTVIETKSDFLTALIAEYLPTCDNLSCGEMVQTINGNYFPEWITWKNRDYTTEDNLNKIWFSDDSFRHQYDEYQIVVVPPVSLVDSFYQTAANVAINVASRNYAQTLEFIQIARNNSPETILSAMSFNYVDPLNNANLINTNWSLLIYGQAGNNSDVLKSAIAEYILTNSIHLVVDWKVIFPDIFKRTEFVLFPRWMNYSIPNMTLQSGIYSPIVNIKKELAYIKAALLDYPGAHVDNYASVMPNPYKSLAISFIGGYENRNNWFLITQVFPDIINVSTSSNDFNRMSSDTKGLMNLLATMIPMAETMTGFSDIPVGFRKVTRNSVIYLATTYLNIEFLVASKLSSPNYV
jgi:hypothetical protein